MTSRVSSNPHTKKAALPSAAFNPSMPFRCFALELLARVWKIQQQLWLILAPVMQAERIVAL